MGRKTLSLIIAIFFIGCSSKILPVKYEYYGDVRMWNKIFEGEEFYEFEDRPLGVILPHHLVAADKIVKFYRGLFKVTNPSVIFVLSPNHYEKGEENIQTCERCLFQTPYGDLEMEGAVVKDWGIFGDEAFLQEHGIYAHTPFIKKFFPEAKIVPILIKWETPKEELVNLAKWLDEKVGNDDLVLASVDFSHYIPAEAADFHDKSSYATIRNFDFENIHDLEVDSRGSLYTILKFLEKRGYRKAMRLEHSNLQDYLSERIFETTSHHYFAFYSGEIEETKGIGIFEAGKFSKMELENMPVKENRFLEGADFYSFDFEDGKCILQEQNYMKIAFCKNKFSDFGADLVYLVYDKEFDRDFARKLVDMGVDILVGTGADFAQPEAYKGALILPSLGQSVAGIYISEEDISVTVFPLGKTESGFVLKDDRIEHSSLKSLR